MNARGRHREWAAGATLAAVATAGVVAAASTQTPRSGAKLVATSWGAADVGPTGSHAGSAASTTSRSFGISGGAAGLYPGATVALPLTVSNPYSFTIDVTSITVSIADAGPGCAAPYLSATSFAGQLLVAAHGTAQTWLSLSLGHAAPDACQGASFPLQYTGSATKP